MNQITISTENRETFSPISNHFIDYYMTEANGDFVKIYLYLVRLHYNKEPISVSNIADHFNCTEKDVCRAIRYWISVDVLKFRYNKSGEIIGIVLLNLTPPSAFETAPKNVVDFTTAFSDLSLLDTGEQKAENNTDVEEDAPVIRKAPEKKKSSAAAISNKQGDEKFKDIINQAEAYFNRVLTQSDLNTLIYIYDNLMLPHDLIEYLLEYCATIGKTKPSYIEKVAINWYEAGIQTREEARTQTQSFHPLCRKVFKELGITSRNIPTSIELTYIETWQQEFGFEDAIILEACKRAVLSKPNSANFAYVNGILDNWHKNNVKSISDIEKLDEAFIKNRFQKNPTKPTVSGSFSDFKQTDTNQDLDEMQQLFQRNINKKANGE